LNDTTGRDDEAERDAHRHSERPPGQQAATSCDPFCLASRPWSKLSVHWLPVNADELLRSFNRRPNFINMFSGYADWNLFSSIGGDRRFGREDRGQCCQEPVILGSPPEEFG
jgi:hypothetical protein